MGVLRPRLLLSLLVSLPGALFGDFGSVEDWCALAELAGSSRIDAVGGRGIGGLVLEAGRAQRNRWNRLTLRLGEEIASDVRGRQDLRLSRAAPTVPAESAVRAGAEVFGAACE